MRTLLLRVGSLSLPLLFLVFGAKAADTLSVSLQDADRLFLKSNLLVLAGQYNLEVADAQAIQARAYPNPSFSAEFNAYDPQNEKVLHAGSTGEKVFGVEQVILLGGKRRSLIEIARQNRELARLDLEDLLRNLRYQLHTSLYTIHQQQAALRRYRIQINFLDTLIGYYETQGKLGNVPLKEVVRLKAARLQLTGDRAESYHGIIEEMSKVRLLLHTEEYVNPAISDSIYGVIENGGQVEPWLDAAITNRPDLKAADVLSKVADLNLKYQRQLVTPDLSLGATYDQRGGAFNNQINGTVGFDLPVWNRNKGAIAAARVQTKAAVTQKEIAMNIVRNDVLTAYDNLRLSIREYRNARQFYNEDFETVFRGVSANFRRRNITLIEFLDFIESYTAAVVEVERAKAQLGIAAERINYSTATPIF